MHCNPWGCKELGDSEGQGSLMRCSPWGCKELDLAEQRNNNWWLWHPLLTDMAESILFITAKFSHLAGVSVFAKQLKDTVLCTPWGGTRMLPQGCTILSWLFLPCRCILETQGRSWRLNEANFLYSINGGHRKAFVPRSPPGYCSVSRW